MNGYVQMIIGALSAAGAYILSLMGGWTPILHALFVLMAVDIIFGIVLCFRGQSKHSKTGYFSSRIFTDGLIRKGAILLVIIVAHEIDIISGLGMVCDAVVLFFATNEAISILENAGSAGLPIPQKLKNVLDTLRNKESVGKV